MPELFTDKLTEMLEACWHLRGKRVPKNWMLAGVFYPDIVMLAGWRYDKFYNNAYDPWFVLDDLVPGNPNLN